MTGEEVRFDSGGIQLAGTYAEAANPVAAALVITGSGKINRDSDARLLGIPVLRTGVTRAVAEALTAAGVSTLRYDKRGIGASGGDMATAGMADVLADARAALGWLASRAGGLPLLAAGHSEGAWHAAQLAADNAVAGAVLLSAGGHPGGEILSWQTDMIAARLPRLTRTILRVTRKDLQGIQRKRLAQIQASQADAIRIQGARVNARWIRDFLAYDPVPVIWPRSPCRCWRSPAGAMSRCRPGTSTSSAASSRAPSRVTWSATSVTCSGPTRTRPARAATAAPCASRSARKSSP